MAELSPSKRTVLYTAIARMENERASAVALDAGGKGEVGKKQNGVMFGAAHHF